MVLISLYYSLCSQVSKKKHISSLIIIIITSTSYLSSKYYFVLPLQHNYGYINLPSKRMQGNMSLSRRNVKFGNFISVISQFS